MKDLHEIASNEALQVSTTVKGGNNGYPSGFEYVITDFFDWKQVEDFVKRYGGTPIMLHKKDGWQMWERCDTVYEPIKVTPELYGDNYDIITKNEYKTEEQFVREFVLQNMDYAESIVVCAEMIDRAKWIWGSISSIQERDDTIPEGVVIYYDGEFGWMEYDTVSLECIEWSHDTHNYMIGVIFNEEEEDDENI